MKSTADKIETLRTATAEAVLEAEPATIAALMAGTTPKGNAVEIARAAGVLAAKKTWELIPYCHPISIDRVELEFHGAGRTVTVRAAATAIARTGVEMEAMTAAMVAALTLYDMGKVIDPQLTIGQVRLIEKRGGKSDFREQVPKEFRAAILVTSDGTYGGKREDKSGPLIRACLARLEIASPVYRVVPDDRAAIAKALRQWIAEGIDLIVTTGGTGLGPRDVTVEATREIVEREIPGIAEAMRSFGQRRTPYAMLSRGIVGVAGNTVIVNLPGSSRGVKESLDAVFPGILHLYPMMGGGGHR